MLEPGHYSVLICALQEAGFAVAGLHLSGHGKCKSEKNFVFNDLLAEGFDAEAWLYRNGYGPIAVCGHSQGGIMALAHAGASETISAAFAICAVFPDMPKAIDLTRFAPLRAQRNKVLNVIKQLEALVPRLPVPLPAYLEMRRIIAGKKAPSIVGRGISRLTYPLKYLSSLFEANIDRHLNCPFWLLNASNDALFTPALIAETLKMIDAEKKTIVWLPGGGHMAPFNPELAHYIARMMAAACSGLGFPLKIVSSQRSL